MPLNTQQLMYLVEIQRTRSISQAAANLYMGQPNLSRILRDAEKSLGFAIFERTRKGVRPTERGLLLLQHAQNILREADFIERLGPNCFQSNRFWVALPRSYTMLEDVTRFLQTLGLHESLDAVIRESHPRHALDLLDSGAVEVALIRYRAGYKDYFLEQAQTRELSMTLLSKLEYQIVFSRDNPLAQLEAVPRDALDHGIEIQHRDTFYLPNKRGADHYRVYAVDRMAQAQLLRSLPNAYLWSEPLPEEMLRFQGLCQRPCAEGGTLYQHALLYKPHCAMSDAEMAFIQWVRE